jgi:hypothetical protein
MAAMLARLKGVALGVFEALAPDPEEARAHTERTYTTVAENSIAQYAMGLLIALIVLLVAILVGGQFAASVPSDNPFSSAMSTTIDTAGTAFEIFGVTLIILPGVAAVALILKGLGGVAGMGGGR